MKGYIWRKEWCWPYESAWGVLEKFKYANALDNQVFDKLLNLRNSSGATFFLKELYIYRDSKLDTKLFYSIFNISSSHFSDLNVFEGNNPNVIFRESLYYCPKCLELGFHSYWHQIKLINNCPFHGEKLKVASYNDKTIKYSIVTLRSEAFSSMRDTKAIPAERFATILPSRVLIDGHWDSLYKEINFPKISLERLVFYNPFQDINGIMKLPQASTYDFMYKLLVNEDKKMKPILKISLDECDKKMESIIEHTKTWFKSKNMLYNHYQVGDCYILSLIQSLISSYDYKEISDTIYKIVTMQRNIGLKSDERFIDIAAALLTAYNTSNARTIWEALDYSLILRPSTHNMRRNMFSLYDMEQFTTKESGIHRYINYLIYERLFILLHQYIKQSLIYSIETNFDYQDTIDFNIPDYVITLKDSQYEIYELYTDN